MQCCAGFHASECELHKSDCPGYSGVRTLSEHAIKIGFSKNKRKFKCEKRTYGAVSLPILGDDSNKINNKVIA